MGIYSYTVECGHLWERQSSTHVVMVVILYCMAKFCFSKIVPGIKQMVLYFICCCSMAQSCSTLWPHELQHTRFPCPSLSPRVCSNSCSLNWWCHPTTLSSVTPFFCPQSFPVSGSFAISQLFASGGQSIGVSVSASVLQGWFPSELTGLISLLSKGLSKVFSSTTVQKHQFLAFHKDSQVPCIPFENYWSCPTDLFCSWRTKRLKRCHLPKEKLIISHFAWF